MIEMAERRGLAPHADGNPHDLVSTESRHAGPVSAPGKVLQAGVAPATDRS
jgi:hypothetical protein